ncbi:hypothetical protein CTKA_01573 [Chthonomonas calidirosea]|uniref:Uncharacterized protein n=1 Tax=Chthonomonas calidirosea (strain DSM 23976 / ICMP 18418 / T49) TaxID=1303518 RepID=S0F012_CHTCT|nr:hypothetical protein CCALI_02518 [Chthonomonas calidirosea T49]CEK17695.1 hypothetical protein CTKA_01573 [Chthonomonas calidirosea]
MPARFTPCACPFYPVPARVCPCACSFHPVCPCDHGFPRNRVVMGVIGRPQGVAPHSFVCLSTNLATRTKPTHIKHPPIVGAGPRACPFHPPCLPVSPLCLSVVITCPQKSGRPWGFPIRATTGGRPYNPIPLSLEGRCECWVGAGPCACPCAPVPARFTPCACPFHTRACPF